MIRRLARAVDAIDAHLGEWPVACAALLLLVVLLGVAMLAGR
jgi:hypothetical protein